MSLTPTSPRTSSDSQESPRLKLPDNLVFPLVNGHQVKMNKDLSSDAVKRTQVVKINMTNFDSLQTQILKGKLIQHHFTVSILHDENKINTFLSVMRSNDNAPTFESEDFEELLGNFATYRV